MALLVNDVTPNVQYTATASQTTFAYPFAIFEDADLKVYQVASGGTPDDTTDLLTLTTHYTVTGAGTTAGGNVVLVTGATSGDVVTIKRDLAIKRTTDYQNNGDLAAESFNDDLDKLVMMVQQNEEAFGRSISLQESTQTPTTFNIDDPVAEYYAVAKADLSGIKWLQLQSAGDISVSAFAETFLDDTTAAEVRSTLGVISEGVYRGIGGGTADAITSALSPTMAALSDGQIVFVKALLANATTTPTFSPDGLTAHTIVRDGSQPLVIGDISRLDHELILRYNATNTEWELLNPTPKKFKGALAYKSASETITTSTYTHLSFDSEDYNTDTIHDTVTNNQRLTVPAGITKIRLSGQVVWGTSATGERNVGISKNDETTNPTGGIGMPKVFSNATGTLGAVQNFSSSIITVAGGDYFTLYVWHNVGSDSSVIGNVQHRTWFAMEIIE